MLMSMFFLLDAKNYADMIDTNRNPAQKKWSLQQKKKH